MTAADTAPPGAGLERDGMSDAFRTALAAHAVPLSQRVLEAMYQTRLLDSSATASESAASPDEDSTDHICHLVLALGHEQSDVFERYARWLRSVLLSGGMCSAHLAENFARLADAIAEAALPDADRARAILDRGRDALVYVEGPAAALEAHAAALVTTVRAADTAEPAMRDDDRLYLVSFLVDAVATGEPAHLLAFAARLPRPPVVALARAARDLDVAAEWLARLEAGDD